MTPALLQHLAAAKAGEQDLEGQAMTNSPLLSVLYNTSDITFKDYQESP